MDHLSESAASLALALGSAIVVFIAARFLPRLFPAARKHSPSDSSRQIKQAGDRVLACLMVASFLIFAALSLLRYYALQNRTSLDMAIFDQTVWNGSAGYLFRSTVLETGGDAINGYFMPLILALVPLYSLLDDSRTLLVLQTLALAIAALPIYWTARRRLGIVLALALSISFFLSPYFHNINLSSFHVIALAVPLLSFGLYFLLLRAYKPFFVCMLLLWLVKEETALLLIGAGVYLLLVQRKRRLGLSLAAAGTVAIVVIIMVVVPALTGRPYFVGRSYYTAYGNSMPEILKTFVMRPDIVLGTLADPGKWGYVADLLVPLGLLPLAGLDVLVVSALPVIGLLLTNPSHGGIDSQYSATVFPTLYFAAIIGIERLVRWTDAASVKRRLAAWVTPGKLGAAALVLVSTGIGYLNLSTGPFARNFDPAFYNVTPQSLAIWDVMSLIPKQASVAAQEELVANFSNRKTVYIFPGVPYYQADYVVLEKGRFFYDMHKGEVERWLNSGYFEIVSDKNDFIVARRREATTPARIRFGDDLSLAAYTLVPASEMYDGTETLRPIVQWRAERNITERYRMTVRLVDEQRHVVAQDEGEPQDGTRPTNQWTAGQAVNDQYALPLSPVLLGGRYTITVQVLDTQSNQYIAGYRTGEDAIAMDTMELAAVSIEKNKGNFIASELDIEQRAMVDMREVRLIGYTPVAQTAKRGTVLPVGLYWRARQKPRGDYVVSVQLKDGVGHTLLERQERPGAGTYPTTGWNEGEVVLDWHDLFIPSDFRAGDYRIVVSLHDEGGSELGQTTLGTVSVGE